MPGFQKNDMQSEPLVFSLELGIAQRIEEPWSKFAHPVKIQYANRLKENLESSSENLVDSDQYTSPNVSVENLDANFDLCPKREEIILTNELQSFTSVSESYPDFSFNQTKPFETLNEGLQSPKSLQYGCHGDVNLEADIVIDHEVENIFKAIKNRNKNLENMTDRDKMEEKDSGILYTFEEITSEEKSDRDLNDEQFNSDLKPRQKLLLGGNLLHDIASHDTGVAWGNKTLGKSSENNHALLQHQREACETNTLQKDNVLIEKSSDKKDDTLSDNGGEDGGLLPKDQLNSNDDSLISINDDNDHNPLFNLEDSSNISATSAAVAEVHEELDENPLMASFDDNFMNQMLDKIVSKVTGGTINPESESIDENSQTMSEVSKQNENVDSESTNIMQISNKLNISVSENVESSVNSPNLIQNDKHDPETQEPFPENYHEKSECSTENYQIKAESSPENVSEKQIQIPDKSLKVLEANSESCLEKPEPISENILEKSATINEDLEENKSSQRIDDKSKPIDKNIEENITGNRNKEVSEPSDESIPENKTSPKKSGKGKQKGGTAKLASYLKGLAKKHKPAAQKTTETTETINAPSSSLPSANDKAVSVSQKLTTQTSGIISSYSDNKSNLTNENKSENHSESDSRSERPVEEEKNDLFNLPSASIIQSSVHDNDLSPLVSQEQCNFSNPFNSVVGSDTENGINGNPDLSQDGLTLNNAISLSTGPLNEHKNQNKNSLFSPDSLEQSESGNENQSRILVQPTERLSTITHVGEPINDTVSSTILRSESSSQSTATTITSLLTTDVEPVTDAIFSPRKSTVTTVSSAITNIEDSVIDVMGSVSESTHTVASVSNDIIVPVTGANISSGINKPKTGDTDIALLDMNDIKNMPSTTVDAKPLPSSSSSLFDTTNKGIEIDENNSMSAEAIDTKQTSSSSFFNTTTKGHSSPVQVETNDGGTQFLSPNGSSVNTGEVKQEEIIETQPCVVAERRNIDLKLDADDDCQTGNEEQKADSTSTSLRDKSQKKKDGTKKLDNIFKSLKTSPKKTKEKSEKMNAKVGKEVEENKDITADVSSDERVSVADDQNQPIPPNTDKNINFAPISESDAQSGLGAEDNNLSEMSQVKCENNSNELTGKCDMLDVSVSMEVPTNVFESLDSKADNLESSKSIPELSQSDGVGTDKVCNVIHDNSISHFNPLLDILDEDEGLIESCAKVQEALEFDSDFGIKKSLSTEEHSGISSLQTFEASDTFISENKTSEGEYLSSDTHSEINETNITCDKNDISASTPSKELFSDNDVFDTATPISVASGHSYVFETYPSDSDIQSLSSPRYDTEQSPCSLVCDSGFLSQHSLSDDGRLDDIATPDSVTKLPKVDSESDFIGPGYVMVSEETYKDSKRTVAMKTENSFDEELFEVNPSIIDECLDIQGNYYESTPLREQSIMEEEESYVSVSPVNDIHELREEGEIEFDTPRNKDIQEFNFDTKNETNQNSSVVTVSQIEESKENEVSHDVKIHQKVDEASKEIPQGSEEKQKEMNRKTSESEEEIIKDKLSESEEDNVKDQLSDGTRDDKPSESEESNEEDGLSKSGDDQVDDDLGPSEPSETKSSDKDSKQTPPVFKEMTTNDEDDEALDFQEAERLNMELMEKLQANQAHLIAIHHSDDEVCQGSENATSNDGSEFREWSEENKLPERPSTLPYYARNPASEIGSETNLPDTSSRPSTLPSHAKTKEESEENISVTSHIVPQRPENADMAEKEKVPKHNQRDENYSFSEFDVDLKLEPVSNIRKMFEKENSFVPSPQSSPTKTKTRSLSKSPQKTDCDIKSPNEHANNNVSKSKTLNETCDGNQTNNDKETETLKVTDVCDMDNRLSTKNIKVSEGNINKLDDQTNKNDMDIISSATPLDDVTKPSVSVRNMLKMWEDNRRRDSHDFGSPIKPLNKLSKKWHSCGHIYFKSDNFDDSTTSVTVDDGHEDITKYGVGDSDHTAQRQKLKDTKPQQDGGHSVTTTTKKETTTEVKGEDKRGGVSSMKIKQETTTVSAPKSSTIHQNGVDTTVTQQTTRQEIRQTETTRTMAAQENNYQGFEDDEDDEGVYENVPAAPRTDVFRETDSKIEVELPQASTAKNMRERFLKLAEESAAGNRTADKELTPPPAIRGPVEAGVFESQPEPSRNDIYHYTEQSKEVTTEKGKAKNTVQKYKEIASREFKGPANKRDITPDRSGVVEYVSEPRAEHLTYEEKPLEAGIFESKPMVAENVSRYEDYVPDELPQQGTARNIASRFHEIERNAALPPAPSNRREVTPDRHGQGEYVSEPRAQHLTYEEKVEGGIYENQPAPVRTDIYRHEEYYTEEPLPEKGYAKNLVHRFKEIEKNAHIHQKTIQRLSPPKDSKAVVFENEPAASPIAYKETVKEEDILPEHGQARNLASRFKQIEQENLKAKGGNRQVKEFTPPKDERTVFESQPSQSSYTYEEREVEHGILESRPAQREDVCRESDPKNFEVELPERGAAKNLLSRWKQIESSSNRASPPTPGRVKEFTPPREEERIKELRSPKSVVSPTGPGNSVHPNDLPGQYQPKNEPTVFESQPTAPREDLFRESDTDWSAGLPKANKTKKVLAKFQAIQSKTQSSPVSPGNRKEEAAPPTPVKETKTKKGSMFMPVQNEKCGACQKTVYVMEKVEMNKNAYHRACFKCSQCSCILTPKTFAINAGTMFCTSHYKQLFARKGNYDEGFGRQQHKKKWKSESNLLDKELVDMEHEIEA